jgi:ABC-2 type transport system permease protein
VLANAERADTDTLAAVSAVLGWTPVGAPYAVGLDVVAGRLWAVPLRLVIVLAAVGGLLWWWSRTLERSMLGAASSARAGSATTTGDPVDALLSRRLPRTRFGALVAREARYWIRENRRRAALITFAAAGVFLPVSLTMSGGGSGLGGLAGVLGAIAAIALANQFGFDGSAYATNVAAGVPGRLEVHSRATAHAIYVLPVLVLIAVVGSVAAGEPAAIAGQLGLLVAAYGVGLGLVLPLSVRAAYALPQSTSPFALSSGGGTAKGLLTLGVLIGTAIATVPLQLIAVGLDNVWPWIGLPAGVGYGAAAYLIGLGVAGDQLDRRMPEVLAAVTPGR